jgi:uncharacterized protein (DUF1499 family)
MLRRMLIGIVVAALIVLALGTGLRLYMERAAEDRLRPGEDIAIADLRGPLPQNGFLICPSGYCAAEPGVTSPEFPVDAARLAELWQELLRGESRVTMLSSDPEGRRFVLIQRSALFRFPDVVTVEFVPLGSDRSSLAIYSRARYGKLDFGVNRKRVERWLFGLQELAGPGSR